MKDIKNISPEQVDDMLVAFLHDDKTIKSVVLELSAKLKKLTKEHRKKDDMLLEAAYSMCDAKGFYMRMEMYNENAFSTIEKFLDEPEIKELIKQGLNK